MAFKVVILANSFPLKVRPSRQTRDQGSYAEWLEKLLAARYPGEPIQVHNFGRFLGMLHHGIAGFDQTVSAIAPDVVIINYGGNECFPRYLPMWFMEFTTRYRLSSNRVASALFKIIDAGHVLVMKPIIRFFRPTGWYSLAKFRRCLTRLIRMTAQETRAHVIVMNLPDIDDRVEDLIPGCRRRIVLFNDTVAEVCDEQGATVVDLYRWIGRDFEGKLPDSFHMNAKAHKLLAEWLEGEIVRLREQASAGAALAKAVPPIEAIRPAAPTKSDTKMLFRVLVKKIGSSLWQKNDGRQTGAGAV